MRLPRTLRARLTFGIAVLVLVVLAVFGLVVYVATERRLTGSLDDSLRANAAQAAAAVNFERGKLQLAPEFEEGPAMRDLRAVGLSLCLFAPDGTVLHQIGPFVSPTISPDMLQAARAGRTTFASRSVGGADARMRVVTQPVREDRRIVGVLQVTLSREPMLDTLRQLRVILVAVVPIVAALSALLGSLLTRRMLHPLERITRMAGRVSIDDLSERLDLPHSDDEVGRLATTLDKMLDRLEESFVRERRFVADASHELRTPLAAVQAILTVVRERPRGHQEYEQALDDIGVETDRLHTLVEALLELARADVGVVGESDTVDLSTLLRDVSASLEVLTEGKEVAVTCDVANGLVVRGDGDALLRLFVNVIDNAIKHTDAGTVAVRASRGKETIDVEIVDTGRGIRDVDLPHVFERFYRGDSSRSSGGAGLGLAIAREIARAHGGTIELASNAGAGTTCRVALPPGR